MTSETSAFAERVADGLRRRGITLRELCRQARLDPSFFSKVLAGKRSPPSEEETLRRIAAVLGLDPAELVVSAGRIPAEWRRVWSDPELFRRLNALATASPGAPPPVPAAASNWRPGPRGARPPARGLSEELL